MMWFKRKETIGETPRKVSKVEATARAYCEELGYDPDLDWYPGPMALSMPLWMKYRHIAEAALRDDAMARAVERCRQIGGSE